MKAHAIVASACAFDAGLQVAGHGPTWLLTWLLLAVAANLTMVICYKEPAHAE